MQTGTINSTIVLAKATTAAAAIALALAATAPHADACATKGAYIKPTGTPHVATPSPTADPTRPRMAPGQQLTADHALAAEARSGAALRPGLRLAATDTAAQGGAGSAPTSNAQNAPTANAKDVKLGNKALVGSALAFVVLLGSILYGVLTRPKDQ